MSYNTNPEWAPVDASALDNLVCPHCQEQFGNYNEVVEPLCNFTYYESRHIPKQLIFTCFNPECRHVDENHTYNLRAVIEVI